MDNAREAAMFSIKDFSSYTGTTPATLRYYDEIGLLPPAARDTNNYRYYRPFQIMTLNFIKVLTDLGVPLAKIKKMTKHRTPQGMIELLRAQEEILDAEFRRLQTAYSILHTFRKNIHSGLSAEEGFIGVKDLDEARLIEGPPNEFGDIGSFYSAFIGFCNSADKYRINLRYPVGGMYAGMGSFMRSPSEPERFFSADPCGNARRPAGKYLVGYQRGFYGQFGDLPGKLDAYAKENGLACEGPVYSLYLLDEVSVDAPDGYLAEVTVGVKKARASRWG